MRGLTETKLKFEMDLELKEDDQHFLGDVSEWQNVPGEAD
jgi:hypothetical protein